MKIHGLVAVVILLLAFTAGGSAQDLPTHSSAQTTVPTDSRFEIIQSNIAVMWTFKLDKFSGQIYQLVHSKDDKLVWDLMEKDPNPANTIVIPGKVNYQIFTSGIAARFTILMNVNSGASWLLTTDTKTDESFWAVLPTPKK